jgi:alpha-mannosidase
MATTESELRAQLGILPSANKVIILGSSAHLDWDWLSTFNDYYSLTQQFLGNTYNAVQEIFTNAAKYLDANKNIGQNCSQPNSLQPPYYYSIAEIGYLEKFASDQPTSFQTLQNVGTLLRIVGGGITSPDNLLSHGETFLRNFLIANTWLLANFSAKPSNGLPPLPPLQQVWTPDDFGHDAQFPILMEAMGLQGVGFSRIPGDPQQYWTFPALSGGAQMAASLLVLGDASGNNKGVDFIWQAADGSKTLAHFMQAGYFQGGGIGGVSDIQTYYNTNQGASTTPYIFVPIANDFSLPVEDLVQYACAWNAKPPVEGVYAVAATFDHYVQLVNFHRHELLTRSSNPGNNIYPFFPAPYWTGCYASRPQIKIGHQQATRNLLAAELLTAVSNSLSISIPANSAQLIADGWEQLTPSTHHDYITGTAANSVYTDEQLVYLNNALTSGGNALTQLQQNIAAQIGITPVTDQIQITVFNQLGFARGGLVEMTAVTAFTPYAFGNENGILGPVQVSSDGTWLFSIPSNEAVPALGYRTYYITSDQSVTVPTLSLSSSQSTGEVTLSNAYLSALLTEADGWGISSLKEIVDGAPTDILEGPANQPIYFKDKIPGNMYKFSTEYGQAFDYTPASLLSSNVQVLENGKVRVRLSVTGNYKVNGASQSLTREYQLVVDEPFLRMITTGAAPQPYSVFVAFPLIASKASTKIESMTHGTTYHWDTKPAQPVVNTHNNWVAPIFSATHDFVIPSSSQGALAAIYHAHLPAWAITGDDLSLIGCLLRNPTNDKDPSSDGGDPDSHTVEYALRVPAGLGSPSTGAPQCESLSYTTPLQACVAGSNSEGKLQKQFSMASISGTGAFITAVKPGTVPEQTVGETVIRVYQPTNTGQQLTLTLPTAPAGQQWQAQGVTALELALTPDKVTTLKVSVNANEVTFFAERAITTLAVSLVAQ